METAAEDVSEGPQPEHFGGADGARTKNSMHPHHEYDNVVLQAKEGDQASAVAAARKDGHGAPEGREVPRRAEEGNETPQRKFPAQ